MYYLSFDCANKSLAVGLYEINKDKIAGTEGGNIMGGLENNIKVLYLDVIDLIPNQKIKDTNLIGRTLSLKNNLLILNSKIEPLITTVDEPIQVMIEYQMHVNDKSRTIFNQLIYEYSEIPKYKITIVKPIIKNTIHLSDDLQYGDFIAKYSSNYRCNKVHSKANFLYFINEFKLQSMIKHIKKSNLDDIADTFMQVVAYLATQE